MQILIISSEKLYPQNTYPSNFELAQAKYLKAKGVDVCIQSVYLLTTKSLIVSLIFVLIGRSSVNFNASRFGFFQMVRFLFLSIFKRKHVQVFQHDIHTIKVVEAIGFKPEKASIIEAALPYWMHAGKKATEDFLKNNKVDIIHAHSRFLFAQVLSYVIKKECGIPYVITEHSSKTLDGSLTSELIEQVKRYYEEAEMVFPVSRAVAEKLKACFRIKALEVLPNVLDDIYMELPFEKAPNAVLTIVSIGRLDKNKNQTLIIDAMALLREKEVFLKLIGEGPTKEELQHKVNDLNLSEKVVFKGHLPRQKIREELLASDVLVVTSKVETFGVVIIEAFACGLPVISTTCGGPEDIITEENGEVVGYNPEDMANAIERMISKKKIYDPIAIREHCIKKYSGDIVADALISRYKEIVNA